MSLLKKILSVFSKEPAPSFEEDCASGKIFRCFVIFWFIFWTILPLISLNNDFIDPLENVVWGRHFQFGYDKNPYLGAWLGHWAWVLTGKSMWINSILCQIFVLIGFCSVYSLAKKLVAPSLALISVLSLAAINFYGMKSVEFCDDVMELGLWPLTILFFYRSLTKGNRLSDWLATGFFIACSMMTKYYALVLAIPMLVVLLFTKEGRNAWKTPSIYCAAVLGFAISLPNLIWLLNNDMVAVNYALGRASLDLGTSVSWTLHLTNPLKAINRALGVVIIPFIFLLPLFFFRRKEKECNADQEHFNRFFLFCFALGPMSITLLFSLCSGASINYSWVIPCFPLLPLLVIYLIDPAMNELKLRYFLTCMIMMGIIFGVIFAVRSLYWQAYTKRGCDYENYPGKALSSIITEDWRKRYRTPLPFVIGDREATCNIAVYSPDHPEAYFSGKKEFSQWIDEDEIREKGAVMLWYGVKESKPNFLKRFAEPEWAVTQMETVQVPRAVPLWFQKLMGREPKKYTATYCFIKPSSGDSKAKK